jgi:hypothetical protein
MTQYPNYAQGGYYAQPVNPRPTSVTVLAIVGMVWGALVLLCNMVSLIPLLVQVGPPNPMIQEMRADPALHNWNIIATVARLVLGVLLLVGSGVALMLKGWGRVLMLVYAVLAIALSLVDTYMTVTHVLPILRRLAASDPNVAQIMGMQRIGMVLGIVIGMLLPLLILFFMTRPNVKAAFAGQAPAPGVIPPAGYPQSSYPQGGPYPPTPPNGPYPS